MRLEVFGFFPSLYELFFSSKAFKEINRKLSSRANGYSHVWAIQLYWDILKEYEGSIGERIGGVVV